MTRAAVVLLAQERQSAVNRVYMHGYDVGRFDVQTCE